MRDRRVKGVLGTKLGMTQVFDERRRVVPVTVIKAGPCVVVQAKDAPRDGYEAVQLGFVEEKPAKVTMALARLSAGNTSRVKWFAGIGEYRIDWGPGYRIYFARFGDSLIMLYGGGTKRRQFGDIDRARQLHVECKARRRSQDHGSEP